MFWTIIIGITIAWITVFAAGAIIGATRLILGKL